MACTEVHVEAKLDFPSPVTCKSGEPLQAPPWSHLLREDSVASRGALSVDVVIHHHPPPSPLVPSFPLEEVGTYK